MKPSDERLIDLYLDMLAAERGAAANTLEAYRRDLSDFSNDLAEHGGGIAKAGSYNIRDYLRRLAARGFAAPSVARRLSAIRQLYRFLYAEGNRKDDPGAAIEGRPPTLAVWGKTDPFFLPAGADAFKRDNPSARVEFFDTGHFALETHHAEIGAKIVEFLTALEPTAVASASR